MNLNKFTWVGILMILSGLENLLRTTPYPLGAKNACTLGCNCLYMGIIWISIGLIILFFQYRKKKNENGKN